MSRLAKITAPSVRGILARPRLFRWLTRKARPSVTWIVGPPGAGKTSLAAIFSQKRKGARLWFQADANDRDPATFFASLGETLRRGTRGRNLPVFKPEYGQDLLPFSRRFFEAFTDRLPANSILVLDNYQEIPLDAPAHDALREGLAVLPPDFRVLVLSRQPPPSHFARLQANGALDLLTWDELRMTEEESQSLLRARLPERLDAARLLSLCRLADGWPAGLVLMAAQARTGGAFAMDPSTLDREVFFEYFAREVFEKSDGELRSLLLKVAVLPRCTASLAQELTGLKRAGGLLRGLARAGYFTVAHGSVNPTYELHPLLREFLLHHALASMTEPEWRHLRSQAALLLERDGQTGEAFRLQHELGALGEQIRLILANARTMMAQGQNQTLLLWFKTLPEEIIGTHGRLSLWFGHSLMPMDLQASRGHFERAFAIFGQEHDASGQLMAWCAVVDSWLYAWDDYSRLDPWFEWLDQHPDLVEQIQDPILDESVTLSMAWAMVHRKPDHPAIQTWVQKAERIFRRGSHPLSRLRAGTIAVMYRFWMGEQVACEGLMHDLRDLARTLQEPMAILTSLWAEAAILTWNGIESERCREITEEGLALGERFGIHFCDFMFHGYAAAWAISGGDLETAKRTLAAMERTLIGHSSHSFFHHLASWARFTAGDLPAALAHTELGVRDAEASGMPLSEAQNHLVLADLLFEAGRFDECWQQEQRLESLVTRNRSPLLEMIFHQGAARRKLPDDSALDHLRKAMRLGREYGFLNRPWQVPAWTLLLCMKALEQDIETPFVQKLIRVHKLKPTDPPLECRNWPWEIRIETFGRFLLWRYGKMLEFPSKVPRKQLLLLKVLITAGPRGIPETKVVDWLWPEAEGDAGHLSLEICLHRLRQLLGVEGAVILKDAHLTLDPHRCWVDAHAFEALLDAQDSSESRFEEAMALYQGPFLDGLEEPWAQRHRDQLSERFLKAILMHGSRLEGVNDFSGAIACYERGLKTEPLAEELYQCIMHCHRLKGSWIGDGDGEGARRGCRRCAAASTTPAAGGHDHGEERRQEQGQATDRG